MPLVVADKIDRPLIEVVTTEKLVDGLALYVIESEGAIGNLIAAILNDDVETDVLGDIAGTTTAVLEAARVDMPKIRFDTTALMSDQYRETIDTRLAGRRMLRLVALVGLAFGRHAVGVNSLVGLVAGRGRNRSRSRGRGRSRLRRRGCNSSLIGLLMNSFLDRFGLGLGCWLGSLDRLREIREFLGASSGGFFRACRSGGCHWC